jgi:hypothetical protein
MKNKVAISPNGAGISKLKTFKNYNGEDHHIYFEAVDSYYVSYEKYKDFMNKHGGVEIARTMDYSETISVYAVESSTGVIVLFTADISGMINSDEAIMPSPDVFLKTEVNVRDLKSIRRYYEMREFGGKLPTDSINVVNFEIMADSSKNPVLRDFKDFLISEGVFMPAIESKADNDKVFIITPSQGGLTLNYHKIDTSSYREDIIENNYNDDFKPAYDKLMEFLSTDGPGLVLFSGAPGTGKTSIINHLASKAEDVDKRFVLLPSAFINILIDPQFTEFAIDEMKNSVLCIEDAEDILRSRVSTHNTAVTNILNMTDGLLGKIANLKIICTLNHEEDIDRALLRRGRLKLKYEFKPLTAEKATKLAKKLGKDVEFKEEVLLSDIYNYGEIVDFDNLEPDINKKKIGFTK